MLKKVLAASVLCVAVSQANASFIGSVEFGAYDAIANINWATGDVTFSQQQNNIRVNHADGFFKYLSVGTLGSLSDFDYKKGTDGAMDLISGNTIWNAGGYSFIGNSIESIIEDDQGDNQGLEVGVWGTLSYKNQTLKGLFTASLDSSTGGKTFSFSTTSTAQQPDAVSEPLSLALFGLGVAGLGLSRRKKA